MAGPLRMPAPGESSLQIVANVNVSSRELPTRISSALFRQPLLLDADHASKFPGDRQLLPLSISRDTLEMTGGDVAVLVVSGYPHELYDELGKPIRPRLEHERTKAYEFSMGTAAAVNLFLEVENLPCSPPADGMRGLDLELFVTNPIFTPDFALGEDFDQFRVDRKSIAVSKLQFLSNLRPIDKLFVCEVEENAPTVRELEAALARARVGPILRKLPADACNDDTWVQDQFQVGFCDDGRGDRIHMVLHLPRLRSETSLADKPNLSTFVEQYFPSRSIGVCRDFWQRKFSVNVVGSGAVSIDFRDTFSIALAFYFVERLWSGCLMLLRIVAASTEISEPEDIAGKIRDATALAVVTAQQYSQADAKLKTPARDRLLEYLAALHAVIRELFTGFTAVGTIVAITRRDDTTIVAGTITDAEIVRLYDALYSLHDSVNYGGNLEVAPEEGKRGGRLVIGSSENRPMHETLVKFLQAQSEQPLLAIDTSWLRVGHVDELVTFVPSATSSKGWVALQNSSDLGLRILLEAARFHFEDDTLEVATTDWDGLSKGTKNLGNSGDERFVSRLLRGRFFQYFFDRTLGAVPQLMPPWMCLRKPESGGTPKPEVVADVYDANISVTEVLAFEREIGMNRTLAAGPLNDLTLLLGDELEANVVMLPAIYDIPEGGLHETFTPNLINMQVVGKHLMVPRPFGPRMQVDEAIKVLKKVMLPDDQSHLTADFARKHGLETQAQNFRGYPETEYYKELQLDQIALLFPDTPMDFKQKLLDANRTAFRPDEILKAGWQTLKIPEKTVDLFELYTAAVLTKLGLEVHFIDTWYYHVRHGGLHCGTNAIRKLPD